MHHAREHLPSLAITFIASLALHTYLVYLNGGFDVGKVTGYTSFLHVGSNPGGSSLLTWMALSGLGWSFARTLIAQGPIRGITSIAMQPVNMVRRFASSTRRDYGSWAIGGGAALAAAGLFGANRPAGFSMAVLWTFLGLSEEGEKLARRVSHALSHLVLHKLGEKTAAVGTVQNAIVAVAPGFALAGVLSSPGIDLVLGALAIAAGVYLLSSRKRGPGFVPAAGHAATLLLLACGVAAAYALLHFMFTQLAWAHDFGKAENDNSFTKALKSGAAGPAVAQGIGTAAAAAVGALAPQIKPGSDAKSPGEEAKPPAPPPRTPDETPAECRGLLEAYQAAAGEARGQGRALQTVRQGYEDAFRNHQNNLAKLTIILGAAAADSVMAGGSAVRGGMGVANALNRLPAGLMEALSNAAARAGSLMQRVAGLMKDLAQLAAELLRLMRGAEEAEGLSAAAEARASLLAEEARSLEAKAGELEPVLSAARASEAAAATAEQAAAERNALGNAMREAETALEEAKKPVAEKAALRSWAEKEKASILDEDRRILSGKRDELDAAQEKLQALRGKDQPAIDSAKAARDAKMEEISAARREADAAANPRRKKAMYEKADEAREAAGQECNAAEAELRSVQAEADQALANDGTLASLKNAETKARADKFEAEAMVKIRQDRLDLAKEDLAIARGATPVDPVQLRQAQSHISQAEEALMAAEEDRDFKSGLFDQAQRARQAREPQVLSPGEEGSVGKRLSAAKARISEAHKKFDEAQAALDKAEKELMPVSHPGIDLDKLAEVEEAAKNRVVQLSREYDELAQRYETLRTAEYTDPTQATQLKDDIARLQSEVRDFSARDWEQVAAERDPGQYQAWKSEAAGTTPDQDAASLEPLKDRVKELHAQEDEIEKRINEARDKVDRSLPSADSVERDLQSAREQLKAKMEELTAARKDLEEKKKAVETARSAVKNAQADKNAAEDQLRSAQAEQKNAEDELKRLEGERDKLQPPKDVFDQASETSHRLRQQLDDALASGIKKVPPLDWLWQGAKWTAGAAGDAFHKAFGGQSPQEVADIIKRGDERVKQWAKWLEDAEKHHAARVQEAADAKKAFDQCVASHGASPAMTTPPSPEPSQPHP